MDKNTAREENIIIKTTPSIQESQYLIKKEKAEPMD